MNLSLKRNPSAFFVVIMNCLLGIILFSSLDAHADGIIVPPTVIQHFPNMPEQRALIVYRNGEENLIVESPFKGEGNEMAWIIPVPAKPTKIEKASPGLFTTLELALQPKVISANPFALFFSLFFIFWGLFVFSVGRSNPDIAHAAWLHSFIITFLLFGPVVLWMGAARMRGGSDNGIDILSSVGVHAEPVVRVGSYDTQILEADSAEHLAQWLTQHGYQSLPPAGNKIVTDYIAKGWKFVASRLHTEGNGLQRPHPLSITFPTDTPIYPMRLTKLAGSDMKLSLFVIADKTAYVEEMKTIYRNGLTHLPGKDFVNKEIYDEEYLDGHFNLKIGLPSLVKLVPEKAQISWLKADLKNTLMNTDFTIQFDEHQPSRQTVFTLSGALYTSIEIGLLIGGIIFLIGAVYHVSRQTKRHQTWFPLLVIGISILVGGIFGMLVYTFLPKAPAIGEAETNNTSLPHLPYLSPEEIVKTLQQYPDVLAKMSVEDVTTYFRDALQGRVNYYTGEPFAFEECPGDIVIKQDNKGIIVETFFNHRFSPMGIPEIIRLTGEEKPIRPDRD